MGKIRDQRAWQQMLRDLERRKALWASSGEGAVAAYLAAAYDGAIALCHWALGAHGDAGDADHTLELLPLVEHPDPAAHLTYIMLEGLSRQNGLAGHRGRALGEWERMIARAALYLVDTSPVDEDRPQRRSDSAEEQHPASPVT